MTSLKGRLSSHYRKMTRYLPQIANFQVTFAQITGASFLGGIESGGYRGGQLTKQDLNDIWIFNGKQM